MLISFEFGNCIYLEHLLEKLMFIIEFYWQIINNSSFTTNHSRHSRMMHTIPFLYFSLSSIETFVMCVIQNNSSLSIIMELNFFFLYVQSISFISITTKIIKFLLHCGLFLFITLFFRKIYIHTIYYT